MKLSGAFEYVRRYGIIIQRNFTKEKVDLIRDPNIYLSYKSYDHKCYSVDVPLIRGIPITKVRLKFRNCAQLLVSYNFILKMIQST